MNEEKIQRLAEDQKRIPGLVELEREQHAAQKEMIALLTGKAMEDELDSLDNQAEFKRVNDRMAASREAIIKFMAGLP